MTKITREKMVHAARNAKHVRVKVPDLEARIFLAQSSRDPQRWYRVRLMIAANGLRLGECACVGFERAGYCRHLSACVGFYRGIIQMRAEAARIAAEHAEKLAATTAMDVASEPEREPLLPPPATDPAEKLAAEHRGYAADDAGAENANHPAPAELPDDSRNIETYCSVCGQETGGDRCDIDPGAEILTREEFERTRRRADRESAVLIKAQPRGGMRLGGFEI